MPSFSVEFSHESVRDFDDIFEHLLESYTGFGESEGEALTRALGRVVRIRDAGLRLGKQPHQGTLEPDLLPEIRHVTKDHAIFYITVDDAAEIVSVLAILFGGQDHQRAMLKRVMGG